MLSGLSHRLGVEVFIPWKHALPPYGRISVQRTPLNIAVRSPCRVVVVMARKPAKMYRRLKGQAFTRRKYMGGVPNNQIVRFLTGDSQAAETGGFELVLELSADESCQIRHTALEASRIICNSTIRKVAGEKGYALRIHTFPHHVLRENKQATGAGADRVSQGMRCAFGKNVGTAARVKHGQRVISLHCNAKDFLTAKDALRKAKMKLPTPCTVSLVRGHELVKGLA